MNEAALVLEDGKVFMGKSFGSSIESVGEVVFNTGMTGYQEILTDPSYTGQIVVLTYPLIGNYGVNSEDIESKCIKAKGLVVKEYSSISGSWKNNNTLNGYLKEYEIPGIYDIDTRALTRYLRDKGVLKGIIASQVADISSLAAKAKAMNYDEECSPFKAGTKVPYHIAGSGYKVTVLDFGVKRNIIRSLIHMDCDITVIPGDSSFEDILATGCDGIIISNGPGDPKSLVNVIPTIKKLINIKPIFGICLGHQILGLALGGETYKLRYGHRGGNHPVKDIRTGRVCITSQNHGFALNLQSIDQKEIMVTHINVNDNSIEGIMHRYLPVFSVQYHPEASPGPQDSDYLFRDFYNAMKVSKIA